MGEQPCVGVITPVYNGARFLDACIASVRAQSYENWEYVIVDNCSTDVTAAIAARHAREEPRIRVVKSAEFRALLPNWNHALRQLPPRARYCKVLHADDLLHPECLEKMIAVAERHPNVGLVGSQVRKGSRVVGTTFPYPDEIRAGRTVARETLLRRYYVFGSPSSTLLRADLVRARTTFYNEENFHADVEACFEVLRATDFGFVHQVLSCTREHEDSQTVSVAERYKTNLLENNLAMLQRFGAAVLSPSEYAALEQRLLRRYYAALAGDLRRFGDPEFRAYQRRTLARLGKRLQHKRLAAAIAARAIGVALRRARRSPAG